MKLLRLYIILFTVFLPVSLSAQFIPYLSFSGQICGQDEFEHTPYPLHGANIHFVCLGDTTYTGTATTDENGYIRREGVPQPKKMKKDMRMRVTVSYVGMEPFDTIVSRKTTVIEGSIITLNCYDIGTVVLQSKPMTLQEAQIIGELKKIYLDGDTTVFNTDAYEMPDGSVLLELVRRLPGLEYLEDALTYKGRNIEEIRLNGDTFFKDDLSIALKNIPNSKLKKLRIYETANDSLDISSPKHLVMDMETKDPVNHTVFVNGEAGKATTPEGWKATGDASFYKRGGAQFFVMGNMQRLPNPQIAEKRLDIGGGTLSYSQDLPKISIHSSLNNFYYKRFHDMDTYTRRFLTENTQFTDSRSEVYSKNMDNTGILNLSGKLSGKARWSTSIKLNHKQEWTQNGNQSETSSISGTITEDRNTLTERTAINSVTQRTANYTQSKGFDWTGGFSIELTPQNSLNLGINLAAKEQHTKDDNRNDITYYLSNTQETYDRHTDNDGSDLNAGGYLNFMRRFGQQHYWKVEYDVKNMYENATYSLYDKEENTAHLNDGLSYDNHTNTLDQNIRGELVLQKNKLILTAQMNVNFRKADYEVSPFARNAVSTDTTVNYIAYQPKLQLKYGGMERNIELTYQGYTNLPELTHLISIPNVNDPLNIVEGNRRLKQTFSHHIGLTTSPHEFFSLNGELTFITHKMDQTRQYNPETGASVIRYDNTEGNWNATYGASFYKMLGEVNWSLKVKDNYDHSVTRVSSFGDNDMQKNITTGHRIQTDCGFNYGNKHLQTSVTFTYTKNLRHNHRLDDRINTDNLSVNFNGTGYLPYNLSLHTNVTYNMYKDSEGEADITNHCLWNLEMEYKFLKNKRGSLKLGWYDVLRNTSQEEHQFSTNEWTETWRSGKTSYALLSFAYRFTLM